MLRKINNMTLEEAIQHVEDVGSKLMLNCEKQLKWLNDEAIT